MKVIIAGPRNLHVSQAHMKRVVAASGFDVTEVVCGMATGIDSCGYTYAVLWNKPVQRFPADWNKHGKAAGPIRNREMAAYAEALIVVCREEVSKGTKNMIDEAMKLNLFIHIEKVKS